jgi:peptidoglycan hydrolase CwlO-like protein
MDDTDQRTVSADGITVKKHIDTDRFKTPAVVLDIVSTADRSATVTLTEPIPEAFAIEDIGFHPDFGGEQWSIAGREITFQRETDPGEEYTTVYGVRGVAPDEIDVFLDTGMSVATDYAGDPEEPADEAEVEAEPVEELIAEDDDEVVRDVIAGDRDSLPEMGDEPAATEGDHEEATDEAAEADAANDRTAEASSDEDHGEAKTDDGDDTAAETTPPKDAAVAGRAAPEGSRTLPGSVAEALAAEVRDGTIAEENERVLQEAFGDPSEEPSGSVDARIEQLQTQVADLAAYTDELERFLDEHGGGDSALSDVEEGLAEVTENVDALEEAVDALETETTDLDEDLEGLESNLEGTQEDVDALETDLGDTQEDVDTLETDLEGTQEDVDALDDRVGETEGRLDEAETGIDDLLYLEEDVMELRSRTEDLPDLEETVEQLSEERVADLDSRLGDLSETVDTLESEMEEMKSFRDRLSNAFGPGGGAPGGAGEE